MPAEAFPFLTPELDSLLRNLPKAILHQAEEIRIRENRPMEIIYGGEYGFVSGRGELRQNPEEGFRPTHEMCMRLLDHITHHSLYTFEEELKRGYITVHGGHRVGLAGRCVLERGAVKHIKDIASFNIRLAREIRGAGREILPLLIDLSEKTVHHTLVISPPQHGKTTLIRDLARSISCGEWGDSRTGMRHGLKTGVVDERSEIAACVKGVPTFDVGPRTDVLDGCPKAEGMMMMIRSMSPDVLVVDEIGRMEDAVAISEALNAGIRVIATTHGRSIDEVKQRPALRELFAARFFTRFVILLRARGKPPTIAVMDQNGRQLRENPSIREVNPFYA